MVFDLPWFLATVFGAKFPALTNAQYDFVFALAEADLTKVACWCPKLYPAALQMKIALLLEGMALGAAVTAVPATAAVGGNYEAYVTEDEVYDVRRKYKIVEKSKQQVIATLPNQLQSLIDRCKAPVGVGAVLARGIYGALGCCVENNIGDKAEWNHGGQGPYGY